MNRRLNLPSLFVTGALLAVSAAAYGQVTSRSAPTRAASPPSWSKLKAVYDYDARAKTVVRTEDRANDDASLLHVEFTRPGAEKVTGLFARPKADGRYPCVLLLHGLSSEKETMAVWFGKPLVKLGFAVLALDAPLHGERKSGSAPLSKPENWGMILYTGCREYRSALDWLQKRKDVDGAHIGLIGYSMGAMMGSILTAVEPRIGAAVLCVGGDMTLQMMDSASAEQRDRISAICPSLYVSQIAPRPLLMLNGRNDRTVPKEASDRVFSAAREPKEQVWFDSGHILPSAAVDKAVSWVAAKIRPGARAH